MSKNNYLLHKIVIMFEMSFVLFFFTGCNCDRCNGEDLSIMNFINQEAEQDEMNIENVNNNPVEATDRPETDGGGNEHTQNEVQIDDDIPEEIVVVYDVLVSSDDYLFDNERISLDELIEKIENEKETIIVVISDDNASLKAYRELIEKLDEMEISYEEK